MADTTSTDMTRGRVNPSECSHCSLPARSDGADQCIGWLPGPIMNACCGHGKGRWAYVQFSPRLRVSGWVARVCQGALMRFRDLTDKSGEGKAPGDVV